MINAINVGYSVDPHGNRILSVLATFPRIILAEVKTHRVLKRTEDGEIEYDAIPMGVNDDEGFSKNTSSSRAIPFPKMVEAVMENPFIPIAWQRHHSGMQGSEYLEWGSEIATSIWLTARNKAVEQAKELTERDVTKQLANRLLEPFMWTTMLITGMVDDGGWNNFFNLRCPSYSSIDTTGENVDKVFHSKRSWKEAHPGAIVDSWSDLDWLKINKGQAEIHIMTLAEKIYDIVQNDTPVKLEEGEWHIPFVDIISKDIDKQCQGINYPMDEDFREINVGNSLVCEIAVKVSTAMAARTSYTVVGDEKEIDYSKMISLHDRLIAQNPPHSSPMEHCARVMTWDEYNENIKGCINTTAFYSDSPRIDIPDSAKGWCRNFKGFIHYRHIIETK